MPAHQQCRALFLGQLGDGVLHSVQFLGQSIELVEASKLRREAERSAVEVMNSRFGFAS